MEISIKEVYSSTEIGAFIKFGFNLYSENEYWIPPLIHYIKKNLSPKHPVLDHGELQLILAYHKNKIVGRAAILINHQENEILGLRQARFGHIEFSNNIHVSKALFKYLEDWTKARDMTQLIGPMHLTIQEPMGLLHTGFNRLGTPTTTYNHYYYPKHLDSLGFLYYKELEELELNTSDSSTQESFFEGLGLRILPIQKKKGLASLLTQAFVLHKTVHTAELGFAALAVEEVNTYKKRLLKFLHHDFIYFLGDADGRMIAYGVAAPTFSKAFQKMNGKLLPFGQFQISKTLKLPKSATLHSIVVHPDWQGKGLEQAILDQILANLSKKGIKKVVSAPILVKTNFHQFLLEQQPTVVRRRRTYIKELFSIS